MGGPISGRGGARGGAWEGRGGWGSQFARGRGGAEEGRRRGRGGGGARRPCAPRPELWARSPSAALLAREGGIGSGCSRCAHSRARCAPAAGGLLSPWLAVAPALRRPLYPTFPLRGRPGTCNPSLGCSGFPRAATNQRVPNFATSPVALSRCEPVHSAAQLKTPRRQAGPPAWRAKRGG